MKAQKNIRQATWLSCGLAFVLAGFFLMRASAATGAAAHANLGSALALRAALSSSKSFFQGVADAGGFDPRHNANGRWIYQPSDLSVQRASAAANSPLIVNEPLQTFDIFAPPPNFDPVSGTNADGSPITVTTAGGGPGALTPTNLTPVWTADQNYMVFASNRSASNPLQVAADGKFHLWIVSSTGNGLPVQITSGPGNEAFPTLDTSNTQIAFTSTALSVAAGVGGPNPPHDLFTLAFTENPTGPTDVSTLTNALNSKTFGNIGGVYDVQRPTWAPVSDDRLVFSALTVQPGGGLPAESFPGHYHLYYLYTTTNGYLPAGQQTQGTPNPPAKLTDGSADDTDPTWEPAGSADYIAFSTTASSLSPESTRLGPGSAATMTVSPTANRSIFVINGASTNTTLGTVVPGGGRITSPGTGDNFGPAWSFATQNQYINPEEAFGGNGVIGGPSFEYLAFARGASPAANHDIYYLRAVSDVNAPTLSPEASTLSDGETNNAVKLNVDDNAGQTGTSGNAFDDIYPTWSPFTSVYSIAYSSNRSVTYNNPANQAAPVETAISVAQGQDNVGVATGNVYPTGQTGAYQAYDDVPGYAQQTGYGAGTANTAKTGYTGILQSEVLNLNPPTLLRYSAGGEIIHVNQANSATDTPTNAPNGGTLSPNQATRQIFPGTFVTFTVRLSNRESGIANDGANNLPDVYMQVKDPDSKYQDSQGLEHKLFAHDRWYNEVRSKDQPTDFYNQTHEPGGTILHPLLDSGSSSLLALADINDVGRQNLFPQGSNHVPYFMHGNTIPVYRTVGAIGGIDNTGGAVGVFPGGFPSDFNHIVLGHDDSQGTNLIYYMGPNGFTSTGFQAVPSGGTGASDNGGDWKNFKPWGPEYECQYVNPIITLQDNRDPGTTAGDYGSPFYLAGYDDQGAFSGYDPTTHDITPPPAPYTFGGNLNIGSMSYHPPRPAVGDANVQWLQMKKSPVQDNLGGVLYYVTWKTPGQFSKGGSDFYLDVAAFDNARFPDLPQNTSAYARPYQPVDGASSSTFSTVKADNWRIYDNIWGFTTQQSIAQNKNILVVSDYALGQKFGFSTFGGQAGSSDLPPKIYGAESYVTDVDTNVLPNAVMFNYHEADAYDVTVGQLLFGMAPGYGANGTYAPPTTAPLDTIYPVTSPAPIIQRLRIFPQGQPFPSEFGTAQNSSILNGLGAGSYSDSSGVVGSSGGVLPPDNLQYPTSQQYAIWRTLCRGPVDPAVLQGYEPKPVSQPAVTDPQNGFTAPAASVLDAHQCVIWLSPFTNDVLAGPGTLADPSTQTQLETFVQAGGRLCVTGEDVASGTAGNGTTTTFLSTVLNASLKSGNGGTPTLTAADGRVTGSGQNGGGGQTFPVFTNENGAGNAVVLFNDESDPANNDLLLSNTFGYPNAPESDTRLDASLDEISPQLLSLGVDNYTGGRQQTAGNAPPIPGFTISPSDFQGQLDTINPLTTTGRTTHTDVTYTDPGLIYYEDANTGSRVVYAAFGLEAIATGYYNWFSENASTAPVDRGSGKTMHFSPYNNRQNILHNIVDYLRTGTISGRVVQNANGTGGVGQPVVNAIVYLTPSAALPGARQTFSGYTDANGNYNIVGVEPGTYGVVAYAPGFTRAASKTAVEVQGDTVAQEQALDIEPVQGGSINGFVKNAAGKGIASATVVFTSTSTVGTKVVLTATTGADGSYSVPSAPVGTYTGVASDLPTYGPSPPSNAPYNTQGVTVVSGGNTGPVNFTLGLAPGAITGKVTDTSNPANPLAGVTVTATQAGGGTITSSAKTDSTGTYTISGVPQGSYTLTAALKGYSQVGTPPTVAVNAGLTTTAPTIQMQQATSVTLQGTVTANGTDLAGATITITNPDGSTATYSPPGPITTDQNGFYSVTILQGSYTIQVSATGYQTQTQSVQVNANPTVVNFTLSTQPPVHIFPGGHYNLLSLPYNDLSATAFTDVFGPVRTLSNPAGNRSLAANYRSALSNYVFEPTYPADAIHAGFGYFVYLYNDVPLLNIPGTPPTGGSVTVPLEGGNGLDGWNMIGVPSTTPINVGGPTGIQVQTSSGFSTDFGDAASTYQLVNPTVYAYNPISNSYTTLGVNSQLQPYQGYWVQALKPGLSLLIPTGGASPAARAGGTAPTAPAAGAGRIGHAAGTGTVLRGGAGLTSQKGNSWHRL